MIQISRPQLGPEETEAVAQVLRSGRLAQGPRVAEFEERFAASVGANFGVAVGNGTQALHLALLVAGVREGDTVVTTPFTFVSTASAVVMCGARPVFMDVEEDTGNLDGKLILARTDMRMAAIVPVHLYGHPAAIEELPDNIPVIIDACQAHGARPLGDTCCWSLYATKNMTTGEGGMITTNDQFVADYLRRLRNHGQSDRYRYRYHHLGYNYRMTEMQAAIGLVQLRKLPQFQAVRRVNAAYLTRHLRGVVTPTVRPGCTHAWHQYTIRVPGGRRDALRAHLAECGIEANVYYPLPLHLQPVFAHLGYGVGDFPVAERLSGEVLSLPVHPGLCQDDLDSIVEAVNEWTG